MLTVEELHAHYRAVRARINRAEPQAVARVTLPLPKKDQPKVIQFTEPTFVNPSDLVIYRVAMRHEVSVADIKGTSRKQRFVYARQEAAYDLRKQRNLSLTKIGQMLGGKDHTTILYAISAHEKRLAERTATLGEPSQVSSPASNCETQAV